MRSMGSLLFWAVFAVVAGAVIWWLLDQDATIGPWLLAVFLVAHGSIHLMFLVPAPEASSTSWPFDMSRSWTITRLGFGGDTVRVLGRGLIGLTVAGFVIAGLSTVGLVIPAEWWQPMMTASAVVSAAMLVLCFSGQMVVGLGIDLVLLWVALDGSWLP